MPLTDEDLRAIDARIEERLAPIRVQREELEALKDATRQLQVEVAHLVHAMEERDRRMEEGFARVWEAIEEQGRRIEAQGQRIEEQGQRIEAQGRRMEEGFAALRQEMEGGFAELRQEMEQGFADLRQENARIWEGMEARDRRMEEGFAELRREIGGLSEAYGLDLEDVGAYVIPRYLVQEEGFEVGPLDRHFLEVAGGEVEIDLFGQARRDGQRWYVVGETKSRVHLTEMRALIERNRRIEAAVGGPILPVLFPRRLHPQALALARSEGFIIIPWNYQYSERCTGAG